MIQEYPNICQFVLPKQNENWEEARIHRKLGLQLHDTDIACDGERS